jgi:acyl-CoA reductase-like NAD-dependent aldehyde dehydrogenase
LHLRKIITTLEDMEKEEIGLILENQKKFFASGKTLDINYRLENLKKLRSLILSHEEELSDALRKDFHKPHFEVLGTESRFVVAEFNMMIRNLRKWSGRQRVKTSLISMRFILSSADTRSHWLLIFSPAAKNLQGSSCQEHRVAQQRSMIQ